MDWGRGVRLLVLPTPPHHQEKEHFFSFFFDGEYPLFLVFFLFVFVLFFV